MLLRARMRPVAAPHRAFGRCFNESLCYRCRVGIPWRPDIADDVCARNLDPGTSRIQQRPDHFMRLMIDAVRHLRFAHVIKHDRRRQALQHRRIVDDLLRLHVELHVPAVLRNALRERLYHVDADHRRLRIADREADTTNAAVVERLQLGIGHRRMQNADAARIGYAELPDGVDGDAVVRHVVAWLHDDDARDAYALLQQPVILHRAVRRMRALRLEARVVNMDMAVGRVRRRLELRRVGAGRVGHLVLYVVVH